MSQNPKRSTKLCPHIVAVAEAAQAQGVSFSLESLETYDGVAHGHCDDDHVVVLVCEACEAEAPLDASGEGLMNVPLLVAEAEIQRAQRDASVAKDQLEAAIRRRDEILAAQQNALDVLAKVKRDVFSPVVVTAEDGVVPQVEPAGEGD